MVAVVNGRGDACAEICSAGGARYDGRGDVGGGNVAGPEGRAVCGAAGRGAGTGARRNATLRVGKRRGERQCGGDGAETGGVLLWEVGGRERGRRHEERGDLDLSGLDVG